jgi:cytidine deaminase
MNTMALTEKDKALIEAAQAVINKYYAYGKHHIGCALRTKEGKVFTGVHVEANVGRVTVCAEAMTLGKALSEGETEFEAIVAVRHPGPEETDRTIKVVAPCGMCRELLSDYCPGIEVIVPMEDGPAKCVVEELLPLKYSRK